MNEAMAVAVSSSVPFHFRPQTVPLGSLHGMAEARESTYRFGRYQDCDSPMGDKTHSTVSLEALAALFRTSHEYDNGEISPPIRSKTFNDYRPSKVRKTQSFPAIKTTPDPTSLQSPRRPSVRRSRSVRFADTQGLPLERIRPLTSDDPFETEGEIVPSLTSDFGALTLTRPSPTQSVTASAEKTTTNKTRHFKFSQPGTQPDFYQRLQDRKVCLESIKSERRAVHGIIRTLNLSYEKLVLVRWTHDGWKSHHDSTCTYCTGSSDGHTDRFSFIIPANGDDIQFAICYRTQGCEYWDNNNGQNYLIAVDH